MKKLSALAALVVAATLSAPGAQASNGDGSASMTIGIRGYVPVICRVQLMGGNVSSGPDADGVFSLGVASEFCNSGSGYRVTIRHPQNLDGGALIVDGMRVPMSASGETV